MTVMKWEKRERRQEAEKKTFRGTCISCRHKAGITVIALFLFWTCVEAAWPQSPEPGNFPPSVFSEEASKMTGKEKAGHTEWHHLDESGRLQVDLHYFGKMNCPMCQKTKPFLRKLGSEYPWLKIHAHELLASKASQTLFRQLAIQIGEKPRAVPSFFFCGKMIVGFYGPEETGQALRAELEKCYEKLRNANGSSAETESPL